MASLILLAVHFPLIALTLWVLYRPLKPAPSETAEGGHFEAGRRPRP